MEKNVTIEKKCEICGETAKNICFNCMNYFCDSCYKYVHDKKEKNQHKKEKIDYFIPIDTKCSNHPKYPIDYFCLDEKGKIIIILLILIF